jgi:hypothetical protein
MFNFTPRPIPEERAPDNHSIRGWQAKSRSGNFGEETNVLPLAEMKPQLIA